MDTSMDTSPQRSEATAETLPAHVPAHGNGVLRPFQPGQSGNPSGKGGLYHEAQRICREASPAAARRMVELMSSTDERVALMAADKVLERAWGKPKQMPQPEDETTAATSERVQDARRKFIDFMNSLAVPEPWTQPGAERGQRAPSRRERRRPTWPTDPPPPDSWPA
jgi:hypothetical protein